MNGVLVSTLIHFVYLMFIGFYRILIMMETVADNKTVNRMSVSAVAACMAPLLLRPLLDGECNLDGQFSMGGGDGSAQLLQAAAAANHAQAIIITLLEEYDNIFGVISTYALIIPIGFTYLTLIFVNMCVHRKVTC